MAVQEYSVFPHKLFPRPRKLARGLNGLRLRALKGRSKARKPAASALGEQGELGWQVLPQNDRSGLALGTAVGTGSYGIVREAYYKGYKVHPSSSCLSPPFISL